jgi:hypothetical protein
MGCDESWMLKVPTLYDVHPNAFKAMIISDTHHFVSFFLIFVKTSGEKPVIGLKKKWEVMKDELTPLF